MAEPRVLLATIARGRRVRALAAPLIAAALQALSASATHAQVDCDQYPAGSARKIACYQEEQQRANEDMQNSYERRQREATDEERRIDRQLRDDEEQADPDAFRDPDADR